LLGITYIDKDNLWACGSYCTIVHTDNGGAVAMDEQVTQVAGTLQIRNYPNPFTTTIEYELSESSHVQLTLYNAIGEEVYQAEDRMMPVGKHIFTWSADRLPEGLYYAVLRSEVGVAVVKMVKQ